MQQLLRGWPPVKMGVESEEEGGPAEEEDAARAMELLDAGPAGSSPGVRCPGDGGKGREGCEGRAPGAVVGARPPGPSRAWRVRALCAGSCTLGRPCIPAHMSGVHLSPGRADFIDLPRGPLMLPAAPTRKIGGPCPFRRRDLAPAQVGKDGPEFSNQAGVPR